MTGRAGPTRVDPAEVARLAAEGYGRNACARLLGVSRRAVDQAAKDAGIEWSRAATEAATRARMADVRAALADDFIDITDRAAERLLDALDADDLDPHILRALANVAGVSVDKLAALSDRLATTDQTGDDLLTRLSAGVAEWAENLANEPNTEHKETEDV